ncbi:MAG: TetR/AcrR family transcriptional regulator [Myxococcales bacterium]|nr:TetR/AcrR family transcriptional regulator [Myxococcales bacterium]
MNVLERPARARGRPPKGDKPRQILDAALHLFAERGYHGVAIPELARAAGVGTGTIYHYFENKERLVNAVFRDAKRRLQGALYAGLELDGGPRSTFLEIWRRLARFARTDPVTFQFLEMQDHVPYLDDESRALERDVLEPLWFAGQAFGKSKRKSALPAATLMALVWGALVGVVKAERLGYLAVENDTLARAGEAAWAMVASGAGLDDAVAKTPQPRHTKR